MFLEKSKRLPSFGTKSRPRPVRTLSQSTAKEFSCPTELLVDDRLDHNFVRQVEEIESDQGIISTISDSEEIHLSRYPRDEEQEPL